MSRIGFLGAGNMASALAAGFIKAGLAQPAELYLYDVIEEKSQKLSESLRAKAATSVRQVMQNCEVIVLAVKPQNAPELLPDVAPWAGPKHLFVSILAGVPTSSLEAQIGGQPRVIRVMPNTPSLVGLGASGVAPGQFATPEDMDLSLALFRSVGIAVAVEESQINAVTAISGSGPAYFFYLIEALVDAATDLGLATETAKALVLQTALGAGKLAVESPDAPAILRAKVTSKGGTTEAGLNQLMERGFAESVKACAAAAAQRAEELARIAH